MTLCYQELNVENFEDIRDELLVFSKKNIELELRYWDVPIIDFFKNTRSFSMFLINNFYSLPIICRFYNSPPFYKLAAHTDNHDNPKNKIGLNIPLVGTENTQMEFYQTPEDNLILSKLGLNGEPTRSVKNLNLLELIDTIELKQPTLVRTDILHGVNNYKSTRRLILGLKFNGSSFKEVYKPLRDL